jgi:tRNA (5-methylaminomethyl-2-thiouridylate)-methyltransferase
MEIKFNYFMNFALSQRCDKVATGHYAKIRYEKNTYSLNIPKDRTKDQTYFLYMLNQDIMKNLLFPLEDIEKTEVKRIVKDFDISIYDKKESMGICFIGKKNFSNFIKQYINDSPGDICDENGLVLGKHNGLFNYTLGQRKGIKIGGLKDYDEKPWFVIKKDSKKNNLIISQNEDKLLSPSIIKLINTSWTNEIPKNNIQYMARFRHNGRLIPVKVSSCDNKYSLNMIELERAITPGQSAVLYKNDECIGGGTIS